jgi:cellobiose-specific phosphotransferase system component IIB
MTKIILMLILAGMSTSAMAEWVEVTAIHSQESPESQIAYVDPATVHKNGNLVNMVVLVDHQSGLSKGMDNKIAKFFSMSKGDITKSWEVQDEFDCKDKKLRMLSYIAYSEHMRSGDIVPNDMVTGDWKPVIPGSIGDALWKYACGKK